MNDQSPIPRRRFASLCCGGLALGAAGMLPLSALASDSKKTDLTPAQALAVLKEGNEKFLTDSPVRAAIGRERRLELARGQTPMAILVCCSDSRVSPELLFGRGLGELFIVRNAGNVVDTAAMGSIEYGVAVLGVPLIVVLGHERCGAVDAAVNVVQKGATYPGSIGQMVEPVIPAVLRAKAQFDARPAGEQADLLDMAVKENVLRVVNRLRSSEAMLLEPLRKKTLMIIGARYDLDDGNVEFFEG